MKGLISAARLGGQARRQQMAIGEGPPPLVSVVTPVFNGESYLRQCIESVLGQTYTHWDYTIVNNCSTDRTLDIAQEYAAKDRRIRVHNNETFVRVIENHNVAFRQISPSSKYCKVIAADDWLYPECLERMVGLAEEHPGVAIVGAYALAGTRVICTGLPVTSTVVPQGRDACRMRLLGGPYVFGAPSCVLFRSDIVRSRHAFYNESNLHADSEVCFEFLGDRDFGFVHQVLTYNRERADSLTSHSAQFNTYLAGWLDELVKYGPKYLTAEELQRRITEHLRGYYEYLGNQVYYQRSPEFWSFHRTKLAAAGHPLSMRRLTWSVIRSGMRLALTPIQTTAKVIRRLRRLVPLPAVAEAISVRPSYVLVLPWSLGSAGGVNQVVRNLYREIYTANELQPLILVQDWPALRPIEGMVDGRRTVRLRLWSPWQESRSISGLLKWILMAPLFLTDLLLFCRRHRVVAFNFHYPSLSAFPIAVLRFLGLYRGALILSFHGTDLRTARGVGRIERALLKWVLRRATAIVACSQGFAADVADFADQRGKDRVHAIYNGLDIDHFVGAVDRTIALPAELRDRRFVLSVSTFDDKKGLDVLVRAFVDVRRANPGLALALVGGAGSAEPDLRALAGKLGIAEDVFFFQNLPHTQVGLFLERAAAFCLPSRTESFGIAILEAGAYRLPVVASDIGGIPEIVIDGETGLLVEPGDPTALASALNRVLADGAFARDLGEGLRRRVADRFSWSRAYEEYRALVAH